MRLLVRFRNREDVSVFDVPNAAKASNPASVARDISIALRDENPSWATGSGDGTHAIVLNLREVAFVEIKT